MRESIGARLSRLRTERGLTQRDLSGPGTSYAYISRIERGERRPSVEALRLLAAKLGTSTEYLETGRKSVLTLMLSDFAPYLEAVGLPPSRLSHGDVERLSQITLECIKSFPNENPFVKAAETLATDIEKRNDPTRHLFP